jgi:hypothetical protein
MKTLYKKWDFWYWLLLVLVPIGVFIFNSDGSLGDAVLLMIISFGFLIFFGIYIVAKIGQLLTRMLLKYTQKH